MEVTDGTYKLLCINNPCILNAAERHWPYLRGRIPLVRLLKYSEVYWLDATLILPGLKGYNKGRARWIKRLSLPSHNFYRLTDMNSSTDNLSTNSNDPCDFEAAQQLTAFTTGPIYHCWTRRRHVSLLVDYYLNKNYPLKKRNSITLIWCRSFTLRIVIVAGIIHSILVRAVVGGLRWKKTFLLGPLFVRKTR